MHTVPAPEPAKSQPPTDRDLTPTVYRAVRALWEFGGYRLTVDDAEVLLPLWKDRDELTDDEFAEVIELALGARSRPSPGSPEGGSDERPHRHPVATCALCADAVG